MHGQHFYIYADDILNRISEERDVVLGLDDKFHHMDYGLYDLVLLQQGLIEGANNGGTCYTHPFSRSIFVKKCLQEIQAEIDNEKALDAAEAQAAAAYHKAEADKKGAKEMEFADDEEDCDDEDINNKRHENGDMKYLVRVCLKKQEEEDYEPDHHSDYSVEDNVYGREDSDEDIEEDFADVVAPEVFPDTGDRDEYDKYFHGRR